MVLNTCMMKMVRILTGHHAHNCAQCHAFIRKWCQNHLNVCGPQPAVGTPRHNSGLNIQ